MEGKWVEEIRKSKNNVLLFDFFHLKETFLKCHNENDHFWIVKT